MIPERELEQVRQINRALPFADPIAQVLPDGYLVFGRARVGGVVKIAKVTDGVIGKFTYATVVDDEH